MNVYLNAINGEVSLTKEAPPQTVFIPVEEVFNSAKKKYKETVSVAIEQNLVFHEDLRIATFTGLSPSNNEFGIEFCYEHEAHEIQNLEQARAIWGLDEELFPLL